MKDRNAPESENILPLDGRVRPNWGVVKWGVVIGLACLGTSAIAAIFARTNIDYPFTLFLNRYAGKSFLFDHFTVAVTTLYLPSGVILMACIWLVWSDEPQPDTHASIMAGVIGASFSGLTSRGLQLVLPTHPRPLHDSALSFVAPHGVDSNLFNHWNSFPSDTASLLFGLATIIAILRPALGVAAVLWAVICTVMRVFDGLHFLSDVTGGAGLAMAIVSLSQHPSFRRYCLAFTRLAKQRPGIFYSSAFVISFEVATLFDDIRYLLHGVAILARSP